MIEKVITCPRCGYQYLPAEIYVPNSFFGSPKYIKRNISGEIQSVSGKESDYTETYKCDNCNTSFKVLAILNLMYRLIILQILNILMKQFLDNDSYSRKTN